MKPRIISIIGGTGKMGQLFSRVFKKNGYKVIVSGRKTKTSHKEAASQGDVVIVTVPIRNTAEIIKKIGRYVRDDALFTDFTSVKTEPVKVMLKYSDAEVVGGHPVFGPTVSLKGQCYVLCPARRKKYFSWFKSFLKKQGLSVLVMSPEEHDKRMGVVQCLTHIGNIAMADAMRRMNANIKKTMEVSSPVYRLRMYVIGRVFSQDASLYSDIQMHNPFSRKIIKEYAKSIERFSKAINKKDSKGFENYFNKTARYLGSFCREAQEESDYLIGKMAGRKE